MIMTKADRIISIILIITLTISIIIDLYKLFG